MKKIITLCLLLIGLTMFGQEKESTIVDKTKETISEYIDYETELSNINDIEGLFVHYFKEVTEGTKSLVGSTVEVAEKTVTLLLEESTIIVKQFIVYTSISHLIPIIFGIWLIFWLPKLIIEKFSIDSENAKAYNVEIENAKDEKTNDRNVYGVTKSKDKKLHYLGNYFNSIFTLLSSNALVYLGYICGVYLVYINFMPLIKVTFFSKLYLVEMLLKYV